MSSAPDKTLVDLPLSSIVADERAQPRAALNKDVVSEYKESMLEGTQFPPLVVSYRSTSPRWWADFLKGLK